MDYRSAALVGFTLLLGLATSAHAQSGDELAPPPPPPGAVETPPPVETPPVAEPPPGDFVEDGPPNGSSPTAPAGYEQPATAQPPYAQPAQPPYAQPGQPYAQPGQPQYAQPGQPQYAQPGPPYGRPQYARRMRIRYQEGMEVPQGAELVERRKTGLWIAGLAIFGATYISSVLVASAGGDLAAFGVPVVGPIIWQVREGDRDTTPLILLDALAQTAGLVLFALGMRKTRYIEYWASTPGGRRLAVIPRISRDQVGLSLSVF